MRWGRTILLWYSYIIWGWVGYNLGTEVPTFLSILFLFWPLIMEVAGNMMDLPRLHEDSDDVC